jgi:hypothetical protein
MTKKAAVFMDLAIIFVIINCFVVLAAGEESNSLIFQGTTVTAIIKEAPLRKVFENVQKETGIWFKVAESELDERVSIQFENLSVKEGLKRILLTMNYSFVFDQDGNLIGAFVFGKKNKQRKSTYPADLNERMLKAAMEGNSTAVVELVAKGADVNAKGKYSGWTPLILASKKGEVELVNYLLSYGADVNIESGVRGRTAIMEAARNRKIGAVKALLTADPDLDAVDWEGYTVLMFAAVSGQRDIVEVLLTHGADVNVKNKVGSSALMMASGYPNILRKLKEAGAEE